MRTVPQIKPGAPHAAIDRKRIYAAMTGIFLVNILLRCFYARYQFINGDEAVRALTALRMLEGGRLYVDVVTDKPPGASLFYLAVLAVFKHNMAAVHFAAILWNFGTAAILYRIGARFYSRSTSLWAAFLFVLFSANYFPQDAMAANTELLLVLPYSLSFYCWLRSSTWNDPRGDHPVGELVRRAAFGWLFAAGLFTGIAVLFKQIGVLNIVFFVLYEIVRPRLGVASIPQPPLINRKAILRIALLLSGSVTPLAAMAGWLWSIGALTGFWRNTVALELFYVSSLPEHIWIKFMVTRTFGYILFTLSLWALASFAVWRALSRSRRSTGRDKSILTPIAAEAPNEGSSNVAFDLTIAVWGAFSFAGVFASGRFYGHYFIPVLPALSLLGARGVDCLRRSAARPENRNRALGVILALAGVFLFGLVRFHLLTAALAYEAVTGRTPGRVARFGATRRETEAVRVASAVRDEVGEGGYIYIWGYALDVYWRSGCRPASRYLTPYYVTGEFYPEVTSAAGPNDGPFWENARAELIDDLKRTRPKLILNIDEPIQSLPYPEIVNFIDENYVRDGTLGQSADYQFVVYRRKD